MAARTPQGTSVTRKELRKAYTAYKNGQSKTSIERGFGVQNSRGKWLSRAWAKELNLFTGNSVLV